MTIPGKPALEVPDADPQAVRGEAFAIRRRLGEGEVRVEGDERLGEGLEGGVQDGEHGEFWVLRERARSREPVEVWEEQRRLVANQDASASSSAGGATAALVGRLAGERASLGDRERAGATT